MIVVREYSYLGARTTVQSSGLHVSSFLKRWLGISTKFVTFVQPSFHRESGVNIKYYILSSSLHSAVLSVRNNDSQSIRYDKRLCDSSRH